MSGMTSPSGSDAEQALVREGDAAVEPLLAALESDDRLTRTVSYPGSRHGWDDRLIHRASQVEQSALIAIMKTHAIPGLTNGGLGDDRAARRASAAAIRAYWENNRGVPELERYYRTLSDDRATKAQWLDAAEALAQPADVRGRGGSYSIPYRAGGKLPPPRGESLRGQNDPGVTALIAKRVDSIDPSTPRAVPHQGSGEIFAVRDANRMATFLADWDPKGAVPTLKARVSRSAAILRGSKFRDVEDGSLATDIARMTTLRLKGEDPSALDDYADWARTVPPGEYRYGLQLPYDCTQAGCGSVSLFTDAEVTTELPDSCTRAAGNSAPAEVTQTPVWVSAGGDGGVLPALACGDGGCSVASETSRSVLSADALAAIIGGLVVLVGLGRRARRA